MRRFLLGLLIVVILAIAVGPRLYDMLRVQRFAYLASSQYEKGKYESAFFYAAIVWQRNPHHDRALEILAAISRRFSRPDALRWTGLWAQNNGSDPVRQLEFANMVLASGQPDAAEKLLSIAEAIPTVDRFRLGDLRSGVALARGRRDEAETIYRKLADEFPGRPVARYNLANILIASPRGEKREEGKSLLLSMWTRREMPLEVSRSLVQLAMAEKNLSPTGPWLQQLETAPAAVLADQLLAGSVMLEKGIKLPPEWFKRLNTLTKTPDDAYRALSWLRGRGLAEDALTWYEGLSPRVSQSAMVHIGHAEALMDLKDWPRLSAQLEQENWGPGNHYRFAFLQEVYFQGGASNRVSQVRQLLWKQMIESLLRSPGDVFRLGELMQNWKWPLEEREQMLAEISGSPDLTPTTLKILIEAARRKNDTLALYYFGQAFLKKEPASLAARNNVAYYGILLRKNEADAFAGAEKLHRDVPDNPTVQATYAFALYQQRRFPEALELFQKLSPDKLNDPGVALVYGLLLKDMGRTNEAAPYLAIAKKAPDLLPEEKKLLERGAGI